jgi:hypothetical protein
MKDPRTEIIEIEYMLDVKQLTPGVIRVTDGLKTLDLYKTKYFAPTEGTRGYMGNDWRNTLETFFDVKPSGLTV